MLSMRRVGLDVHAKETTAVVLDGVSGEIEVRRIAGRPEQVLAWLETLEAPFQAVYEAGPTGYGLSRRAAERGLDVQVCSPGHIARRAGDRIKTDRRDAERLARLLLAGELTLVRVPEPAEEQLRDLVRAREDLRVDLMRCRHRINKFLLRRELYYPKPGGAWTGLHRDWLASLRFDDAASELTFEDMLHAHDSMLARRERLERALGELAEASPWAATINRLRCLRGIDTLSAVGLQAEIGDFQRFAHPKQARGLPRPGTERAHKRRAAPAGRDHQSRLQARPPAARRGRLALPPPATHQHDPGAPPARPGPTRHRRRLALPTTPLRALATARRRARQAPHDLRGRGRTRALELLLGDRPAALSPQHRHTRGCRGGARRTIRATPRTPARARAMGNRPTLGSARF